MKKTTLLLMLAILLLMLTACGNKSTTTITTNPTDAASDENIMATIDDASGETNHTNETTFFKDAPAEGDEIEAYRAEVSSRLSVMEKNESANFCTEEEKSVLQENGYDMFGDDAGISRYDNMYMELDIYYYPVLYKGSNGSIQLWCTTENGRLYQVALTGKLDDGDSTNYMGNVHCQDESYENENFEIVNDTYAYAAVYENNKMSFWHLGELLCEHELPEGAVYAGMSDWVGYIFREGTDVYALKDYGVLNLNDYEETCCTVKPIAHGVDMVIDANYDMGSDDWAQPLFLMKDGTVKGYCEWVGDPDAPSDDPSHLYEIRYEGGYHK